MEKILRQSYLKVIEDEKFIKLTFFSLLPYSLLFVVYLFYQTYFFITSFNNWVNWWEFKSYIQTIFSFWEISVFVVWVILVILLAIYFFIPPIAEAALINYLRNWGTISSALWKWIVKFFYMLELHWFLSLFSFMFFIIVTSRLYILNMLDPVFIKPLLFLWLVLIIFFNFITVYSRFLIVIDWLSPFEAIKKSMKLSFLNLSTTFKGFVIYMFLYFRFFLNILILIGIPLFVLYLFLRTNIFHTEIVKYTIYAIIVILFIVTAYINSLIEAFFISMWYNIFMKIDKE